MSQARAVGPLEGVRVLELGRYIAAPYAGRLLSDLGADVVKLEDPDGGDPMRRWESAKRPYSPQFAAYNLNKRSVGVDLKTTEGRETVRNLARDADVFLENLRPGVTDRLGIGPDALRALNPRLVYCSVTGFGRDGPRAQEPSYDTVISAAGGLYSLLMPTESPSPVGPAMSDLLSAQFAVHGILAALYQRSLTGQGQQVEVSMLGSVVGFLTEPITHVLETGQRIEPNSRQRRAQAYGCVDRDGKAFVVHLSVPEKFWHALTDAMERPDWRADPRFATRQDRHDNYAALDADIKAQARSRTRDEWFDRFRERDLPHGPLNTIADVCVDPQVTVMELLCDVEVPHDQAPMRSAKAGILFSGADPVPLRAAPALGADTAALAGSGSST